MICRVDFNPYNIVRDESEFTEDTTISGFSSTPITFFQSPTPDPLTSDSSTPDPSLNIPRFPALPPGLCPNHLQPEFKLIAVHFPGRPPGRPPGHPPPKKESSQFPGTAPGIPPSRAAKRRSNGFPGIPPGSPPSSFKKFQKACPLVSPIAKESRTPKAKPPRATSRRSPGSHWD